MYRAVFVDRDGTMARDVPYCSRPQDFQLLPGVAEAIKNLNCSGFKVIVITNQSGVGRGFFTEEILWLIHMKMQDDLRKSGAYIDGIYYCPHHPDDNCECRKPRTGLLRRAARELAVDLERSFMVGDMANDVEAGQAVRCQTILLANRNEESVQLKIRPDNTVADFSEAVRWILRKP